MSDPTLIEVIEWLEAKAMALPVTDFDRDKYLYVASLLVRNKNK